MKTIFAKKVVLITDHTFFFWAGSHIKWSFTRPFISYIMVLRSTTFFLDSGWYLKKWSFTRPFISYILVLYKTAYFFFSVRRSVGWLVGQSVGWSIGRLLGR